MKQRAVDDEPETKHAYYVFETKNVGSEDGVLIGTATTSSEDRMKDIVEPMGAVFKMPLPLLWQHDHGEPIGTVDEVSISEAGIDVVARVKLGIDAEIDRAYTKIKEGLVRGLSIGFRGIDVETIKETGGLHFKTWEWLELSAVTIPANAEASIALVKEYAERRPQPAASGKGLPVVRLSDDPARVGAKPYRIRKIHV